MNKNLTYKNLLMLLLLMSISVATVFGQSRQKYRTFDGSANNLIHPEYGKTGVPFHRVLPAQYGAADPLNALAGEGLPNPRALSNKLSDEPEDVFSDRDMSGIAYIWGQFLDHDMTLKADGIEPAFIPLPANEENFTAPVRFMRSAPHLGTGINTPREQTNTNTAWLDASMVYGVTKKRADWLRTFRDGKLKTSRGNLLPFNTTTGEYESPMDLNAPRMEDDRDNRTNAPKKTFVAGDIRANENPSLLSLQTLFMREHNRICDRLKSEGYTNDEEIYQKARKEVGAIVQAITYGQWASAYGIPMPAYSGYNRTIVLIASENPIKVVFR